MASSINASTSGGGGVIVTSDATGNLNIQSGGSTVVAVTATGATVTGTLAVSGGVTLTTTLPVLQGGTGVTTSTGTGAGVHAATPVFTTTIGVGAATASASGSGITFPATQSASSDANTLDDYEEGAWTPNQGAGLTVIGAFSSAGTYTKVGNIVYMTGRVNGATSVAVGVTGQISSNLPFNVLSTNPSNGWGVISNNSGTVAGIINVGGGSVINNGTAISATTSIFFSATYTTTT